MLRNSTVIREPGLENVQAALLASELVVGGRMHLAILAWTLGKTVVAKGYQGKFEGMFADMTSEGLLAASYEDLVRLVPATLSNLSQTQEAVAVALPKMRSRARQMMAG